MFGQGFVVGLEFAADQFLVRVSVRDVEDVWITPSCSLAAA